MTRTHWLEEFRRGLETRLESAARSLGGSGTALSRDAVERSDDRWYGELVARSYLTVNETSSHDVERVVPAAAAIELLRGYCRLRCDLCNRAAAETAHSSTRDTTAALLAGDHLYSSAYSSLDAVEHNRLNDCYEVMTDVSGTIVEAFGAAYDRSPSSADNATFVDETAGALGRGATVLGATLADGGPDSRDRVAVLGRGYSTARGIRRLLDADASLAPASPPDLREDRLRRHAAQRRDEADRALASLSGDVDAEPLRSLVGPGSADVDLD